MSLKELTKESHTAAEKTLFMKAVFTRKLPLDLWADWTYQKAHFYKAIEERCRQTGLLAELPGLERADLLLEDWHEMSGYIGYKEPRKSTQEYVDYIYNLNPKLVAAHLYTWHMGDMSGGQMIKKVIAAPHRNLDFANADVLKETIRSKLDDSFADEANRAFAWAIKLMNEYEFSLG